MLLTDLAFEASPLSFRASAYILVRSRNTNRYAATKDDMAKGPFAELIDIPEAKLVEAIFGDHLLAHPVGVPPSIERPYDVRFRVPPERLGLPKGAFGDVDALPLERTSDSQASAVEFKRIKVTPSSFNTRELNKLRELQKAANQVNALWKAGFAHVWLTILVVADVRPITGGTGFAATPGPLISLVDQAIPFGAIHPSVGVQRCEITQVSDAPANERGGAGWSLLRSAAAKDQPALLTEAIADLFGR